MTALFYKDLYFTVRVVRQGVFSGHYSVFSEVRRREDDPQPIRSFFTSGRFDTEDAAYKFGLERVKVWIDDHPLGD